MSKKTIHLQHLGVLATVQKTGEARAADAYAGTVVYYQDINGNPQPVGTKNIIYTTERLDFDKDAILTTELEPGSFFRIENVRDKHTSADEDIQIQHAARANLGPDVDLYFYGMSYGQIEIVRDLVSKN